MNYPFTFNQMFNPYSDNPKFLKKVFNTRLIPVMIALLSVIIISLIFGDACIFGNSSSSGIILSPDDELTAGITSAYEGLVMTLTAAAVFLPFIGLVSLLINSGKNSSPDIVITPAPFNLFRVFFILAFLHSLSQLAGSSFYSVFAALLSDSNSDGTEIISLLQTILPPVAYAFWTFSGFLFCNSIIKTVKCSDINHSSGRFFIIASFANALITITCLIFYIAFGFSTGMFKNTDGSISIRKQIIDNVPSAPVMFIIYYLFCAALFILCIMLAKRYIASIENAKVSIKMHGTNMYMNSDGNAAGFYSSTYTSPESISSAPPQAQQSFEPVSVQPEPPQSDLTAVNQSDQPPVPETGNNDPAQNDSSQDKTYICSKCGSLNLSKNNFCYSCGNNRFNT